MTGHNCMKCGAEMFWTGDEMVEDEFEEFDMTTVLTCPDCYSILEFYYAKERELLDGETGE